MRRLLLTAIAIFASCAPATVAHAQEATLAIGTSSVDTYDLNVPISDEPIIKLDLTFDLGNGVYAAPYVYSGLKDPLNDEGSEYGFEVGWEGDVSERTTLKVAAGRYAGYGGEGFGEGDWFARLGVIHQGFDLSVTAFAGASDTVALRAAKELTLSDRLTVTPSLAYLTNGGALNPGVVADYRLTDTLGLQAQLVLPEHDGGKRKVYAAVSLIFNFGT